MVNAIFFDRDGVLCDLVPRPDGTHTAPWAWHEFKLKPRIAEATALNRRVYKQFVITNQPDVLDGKLTLKELESFHRLIQYKCGFDEIVYCLKRNTHCYKPNTGMVEYLVQKYDIDVTQSFLIGDRWKDIVCGENSGLYTIFTGTKYNDGGTSIYPHAMVPDVFAACELIMRGVNHGD